MFTDAPCPNCWTCQGSQCSWHVRTLRSSYISPKIGQFGYWASRLKGHLFTSGGKLCLPLIDSTGSIETLPDGSNIVKGNILWSIACNHRSSLRGCLRWTGPGKASQPPWLQFSWCHSQPLLSEGLVSSHSNFLSPSLSAIFIYSVHISSNFRKL